MADLAVDLLGLHFPNPVLAGAGPATSHADGLVAALDGGAGGLVSRTIRLAPGALPPEPTQVNYGRDGLLSQMQPSAVPADSWIVEHFPTVTAVAEAHGVPVIASLGGTAEEVTELGPRLALAGVQALEYATAYVTWPEAVAALSALRRAVSVPIIAKLSLAHGEDIAERAAAVQGDVDAFTCMAGFGPVLDIDVESGGRPRLGGPGGYGWLSGRPIHPIAVRTVFDVARKVQKPVIASGGALRVEDVAEFLAVGASLVAVTSAALLKGPLIYGALARSLDTWLTDRAIASVSSLTGQYLQRFGQGQRVVTEWEEAPALADALCTHCGICGEACYYDAIKAPKGSLPQIDAGHCLQCGLCVSACPPGALSFRPRESVTMLPSP